MPRRKESSNVKSLRGTNQPCRASTPAIEIEPLTEAPPAPDWLEIEARKYWERITPILIGKKVLTHADLEGLEVMCVVYGKIRKLAIAGVDINSAAVTQLRLYQTEYGLTPASRTKITAGDAPGSGNTFGKNGQRPGK